MKKSEIGTKRLELEPKMPKAGGERERRESRSAVRRKTSKDGERIRVFLCSCVDHYFKARFHEQQCV